MEYKDGLPVLNYEELVSYIMEENRYPRMWRNPRNELYHKL